MEWVVIWIICGIGASAIASSKGMSAGAWFFGGLLLGPLGLLIVGFMASEKKESQSEPESPKALERKCPFCAEMIKAEAIVCRFCGRDVEPVAIAEQADALETEAQEVQEVQAPEQQKIDTSGVIALMVLAGLIILFMILK